MLAKYTNIIIIVVIIILGFFLYSILKPDPEEEKLLQSSGPQQAQVLGEDIIRALNEIDALVLDASILDDQIIKSLTDHSHPIKEEPFGKNNPFSQFGDTGVADPEADTTEDPGAEEEFTF